MGADVVEFTPIYDNAAETTGIAVGQIIYEILHWMVSGFQATDTCRENYAHYNFRFAFQSRDRSLEIPG